MPERQFGSESGEGFAAGGAFAERRSSAESKCNVAEAVLRNLLTQGAVPVLEFGDCPHDCDAGTCDAGTVPIAMKKVMKCDAGTVPIAMMSPLRWFQLPYLG